MSMFTDRLRNDRNPFDNWDIREQAADKIDALEAALREIISCWDQVPVDNSAWNVWSFRVQDIARAALAPEPDK